MWEVYEDILLLEGLPTIVSLARFSARRGSQYY